MIYLDDDLEHFDLEKALPFLSEQRRNQLYQFRFEQERKMCALSYLLLCDGLRKEYGITDKPLFEYGRYGKPSIQGHPEIHFNISHCSEAVICVLSECPVGVDIESLLEYEESLMTYTMNEYEKNIILNSSRPDMEFIRFWTMKEAILKCEGEGLLDNITSVLDKKRRSLELITKEHSKNRYVYSICYDKPFVNS